MKHSKIEQNIKKSVISATGCANSAQLCDRGGRVVILITVGQGPIALAVGAGGGCFDIFTLNYPFFLLSPSLWETARYRLRYCLKGPLTQNQPMVGW